QRARLAFLQKDERALDEQFKWAEGKPDAYRFLWYKSLVEAYYGRFRSARLLGQQAADQATKADDGAFFKTFSALQEAEVGNLSMCQRLAKEALTGIPNPDPNLNLRLALTLARAGQLEQAQKLADALDQEFPLDTVIQKFSLPTIRAAIKLDENDPASAVEI